MIRRSQLGSLPSFDLGGFSLHPFAGDALMVVRVEGSQGALAPQHVHPHEQMTLVERGRVRFRLGDETVEVVAGDCLHIPSETPHEALVLEDTVFFDIFHPVREDFLERVAALDSGQAANR